MSRPDDKTKREDELATTAEELTTSAAVEPTTEEAQTPGSKRRRLPRRKAAEPTVEPAVAETVAEDAKIPEPTVEAPRIRGASVVEPTDVDATDSDYSEDPEGLEDPEDSFGLEGPSPDPDVEGRNIQWSRVLAFGVLPGLALILALTAGFLKYVDNSVRDGNLASVQSVQAAKDGTVALLSYKPETVEKQLGDARSLLTGEFQQSYTDLTSNVVIPGAKQQQISASARVPAVAAVSADLNHAVVLVFVNQTVVVGQGAPSDTASSVRVTLDKVGDKWLISKFDPV